MEPEVLHQFEVRMEELKARAYNYQQVHPFMFAIMDKVLSITKMFDKNKQSLKLKDK